MSDTSHSRRDALKILGAGAAFSCLPGTAGAREFSNTPGMRYFPLRDVRLGDGPFLRAQKLDEDYLLRLEPDRMLHNFRVNAGLAPKAAVYGGWESVEPWIDIRCHGHTLGHYLSATACMYAATGDIRFAERVDHIVDDLAECQQKTGGWLTAFPDGVEPLSRSLQGQTFPGVPWYTVHKVLAGLRDAHLQRGNKLALKVWVRFADWIYANSKDLPEDRFQQMLDREHGGMNEVFAELHAITGNTRYSTMALRFTHRKLLDPLKNGVDSLDGLHANTQIPKVVGFSRFDELMGARGFQEPAAFFWQTVTRNRSFVTGGHGDGEHFFPPAEFARHLNSGKTMETCCTHNMLRLTRALYMKDPKVEYFDYFERALFNGILASQDPETGMNTYFQSTRPGYVRLYHTPVDSFWCCTGSGIENHARYGESIYSRENDALLVNLFIASTLQWRERGLTVTQSGNFPDEDVVTLRFDGSRAAKVSLCIRHPSWCEEMSVSHNATEVKSSRSGRYLRLPGLVHAGDTVTIRLPMRIAVDPLPGASDFAALRYGPIVLACRLGSAGLSPGSQLIVNERESGNMLNVDVPLPRWSRPLAELASNTTRTNPSRLEFRTSGFDGGVSIESIPWFRLAHERYNLYWQGKSPT